MSTQNIKQKKLFAVIAILFFCLFANAQNPQQDPELPSGEIPEDAGSFESGTGAAPGNHDSEFNSNIRMRGPRIRGSGCLDGEFSATLSPDKKTLSVLFDNFIVHAGGETSKVRDTKICSLTIPFEVPAGFRVSVVKMDYRGYNQIPSQAGSRLFASYNFVNAVTQRPYGARVTRVVNFRGPQDSEYIVSSQLKQRPVWSECGKSFNLNIDAKLLTVTNKNLEEALSTVDSMDVAAEEQVRYALLWRSCNENGNNSGNGRGSGRDGDPRAREREERERQQRERREVPPRCRTSQCR